jgi:hypothetical protein
MSSPLEVRVIGSLPQIHPFEGTFSFPFPLGEFLPESGRGKNYFAVIGDF